MAASARLARGHAKYPPYGKQLVARRVAREVIGLCVLAAGSFGAGLHYDGNPKVARVVVPLDGDLPRYDWELMLVGLDVLICPAPTAPASWLDLLVRQVFAAQPRMVFLETSLEDWDGSVSEGVFRVRPLGSGWGPSGIEPPMSPAELPLYIARQQHTQRWAQRYYQDNTGEDPDMTGWWR